MTDLEPGATVANAQAGWYDDGSGQQRYWDGEKWTDHTHEPSPHASGLIDRLQAEATAGARAHTGTQGQAYVVLQVILKEKLWGTGSGNLTELERAINAQAALGYRLHTISTSASGSKGFAGGDRIQATMVFERL